MLRFRPPMQKPIEKQARLTGPKVFVSCGYFTADPGQLLVKQGREKYQ